VKVGLISDTHGLLRPEVFRVFEGVDRILHAGDVGGEDILIELRAIAPVDAVYGNTDGWDLRAALKAERTLRLGSTVITLVHGDALGSPTPMLLRRAYPASDVIVYGHTHVQLVDQADGAALTINPGAAGPARFKLKPSVALLSLNGGDPTVRIVPLK
jgi:putative phosphoesterase